MRARAPASSANLGPGFDALAVAVALYVEVEAVPSSRLSVTAEGEGAAFAADGQDHLAARVARDVAGHDRFDLRVSSEIPVGRGLGSSAALALAAAAACGANDPLSVAVRWEGHPENAAASLLGGLVAASSLPEGPVARRLPLDPALTFVLVVPDRTLSTSDARSALPKLVPLADAASNLGRMGLLIAGLADKSQLVPGAADDLLHQPARATLFPEAEHLMAVLRASGALVASWSGAGPTLIGVCGVEEAASVRDGAVDALDTSGIAGRVMIVGADTRGLVVS